ncbi:MAG: hypothetical protein K6T57_12730 [Thermaceae bacterium]|nr:hypothetical protein [Thermaceae bacterium]
MTQHTRSSRILTLSQPHLRRKALLRSGAKKRRGQEPLVTAFYTWLESACPRLDGETLKGRVIYHKTQLSNFRDLREQAVLEIATAVWLHRILVTRAPLFARARGQLLSNAETATLLAELLREAGLEVLRVRARWDREIQVETLLRLHDGRELLVNEQGPLG